MFLINFTRKQERRKSVVDSAQTSIEMTNLQIPVTSQLPFLLPISTPHTTINNAKVPLEYAVSLTSTAFTPLQGVAYTYDAISGIVFATNRRWVGSVWEASLPLPPLSSACALDMITTTTLNGHPLPWEIEWFLARINVELVGECTIDKNGVVYRGQKRDYGDHIEYFPSPPFMASFPQGKSVSEMQEAFDSTPLFMSSLPNDHEDNPALSALQSLIYDDDPLETAFNFKNQANQWFMTRPATLKTRKEAVTFYSKALTTACKDDDLNATIYCNRAAVQIELENYGSALRDCKCALMLRPGMVKAWYRAAKASIAIEKIDDATDAIERGLKIDPTNVVLMALKKECDKLAQKLLARETCLEKRARSAEKVEADLVSIIASRAVQMLDANGRRISVPQTFTHPFSGNHRVSLSIDNLLLWPVMILYPEHQESDFIAGFNECDTLRDHLDVIFEQAAPWDIERMYTHDKLVAYFVADSGGVGRIGLDLTLRELLEHPDYRICDGVVSIHVVVAGSPFEKSFVKQSNK